MPMTCLAFAPGAIGWVELDDLCGSPMPRGAFAGTLTTNGDPLYCGRSSHRFGRTSWTASTGQCDPMDPPFSRVTHH